jgi:hypothetical protein
MKKGYLAVFVIASFVLGSCQKEKIKDPDPLVGNWELTDFTLEIYEDNILTSNVSLTKGVSDYYGVMKLKEEGVFDSDINEEVNLQLAYFTVGYSANNILNSGSTRGTWRKLNDELIQFDKGIPELLTGLDGEGHTVNYILSGDELTIKPHTFDDIAYFGYYAGYESNPPTYFGPSAASIVTAAQGQADEYTKGYYYGYYMGHFQGQIDQLESNGGYYYEPLTYGLLLGSMNTLEDYEESDNSGTDFENGYNSIYQTRYDDGVIFADSLLTSPAKSYTLEYKFSKY